MASVSEVQRDFRVFKKKYRAGYSHRPARSRSFFVENFPALYLDIAKHQVCKEFDLKAGQFHVISMIYYYSLIHKSGVTIDDIKDVSYLSRPSIANYIFFMRNRNIIVSIDSHELQNYPGTSPLRSPGYILTDAGERIIRRFSAIMTNLRKKFYNPADPDGERV